MGGCGSRGGAVWSGGGVSGRPEAAGKARYNDQVEGMCIVV